MFIVSDTETEAQLSKNTGAWSRLATPVIVDDLHREEALTFLRAPYLREHDQLAAQTADDIGIRRSTSPRTGKMMDEERAGRIVEMVGGRMLQLIAMKRDWLYGVSFDDSANQLKNRERDKLLQVQRLFY